MIHHRTKAEVRRFDLFKLVVTLILLALLIWRLLAGQSNAAVVETRVEETAAAAPTAVVEPEMPESEPDMPVAPGIQLPSGDLHPGEVTLTGTGEPGTTVELMVNGTSAGQAMVGSDGSWSLPLLLDSGTVSIQARSLDAAGKGTAVSDPVKLTIAAPTGPIIHPLGDFTEGEVNWKGQADPGAVVELLVDGEVVGQTVADANGDWTLPVEMAAGDYDISARTLDEAGNLVAESEPINFSIEPAIVMPTITLPDAQVSNPFPLSGMGTPGSEVEILVDGAIVGTAVVGSDGTWSFDYQLEPGDHEIGLQTTDTSGQLLAVEPFSFTMPEKAVVPAITNPASGAELDSGELVIRGTGSPGAEVELLDNGVVVGTAVVGEDGSWQISYTPEAGEHEFVIRAAGSETGSEPVPVSVAQAAAAPYVCTDPQPGIDQGDIYIVGNCEWLTKIAKRLGIEYRDLIAVNPQITNPNIVHPGQVINLPPR